MIFRIFLFFLLGFNLVAMAQEEFEFEVEREPATISLSTQRSYPGARDEDQLQVQSQLSEPLAKMDTRGIQREVYRGLFNQELKDDRQETMEE